MSVLHPSKSSVFHWTPSIPSYCLLATAISLPFLLSTRSIQHSDFLPGSLKIPFRIQLKDKDSEFRILRNSPSASVNHMNPLFLNGNLLARPFLRPTKSQSWIHAAAASLARLTTCALARTTITWSSIPPNKHTMSLLVLMQVLSSKSSDRPQSHSPLMPPRRRLSRGNK